MQALFLRDQNNPMLYYLTCFFSLFPNPNAGSADILQLFFSKNIVIALEENPSNSSLKAVALAVSDHKKVNCLPLLIFFSYCY